MGLSSIGITFLFLPLCVSPLPQTFELGMKRDLEMKAASEVSLGYDLDLVDNPAAAAAAAETKSNQSDLVQSMALTCPPPVASFLRFDLKNASTSTINISLYWSFRLSDIIIIGILTITLSILTRSNFQFRRPTVQRCQLQVCPFGKERGEWDI